MPTRLNEFGQPIGPAMDGWHPAALPERVTLTGRTCRIEPLNAAAHAADLFEAYAEAPNTSMWTYLRQGPFTTAADYLAWAKVAENSTDPMTYTVIETATNTPLGTLSLLRIDPANGVVEIGNVVFSPKMQGTIISTEAQFLMMHYVFQILGYRRYEWKCDDLNKPSLKAAERLGFQYEGTFRNAVIYKGRSRNTAWFAITDTEWAQLAPSYRQWLSPENFTSQGKQIRSLAEIRESSF